MDTTTAESKFTPEKHYIAFLLLLLVLLSVPPPANASHGTAGICARTTLIHDTLVETIAGIPDYADITDCADITATHLEVIWGWSSLRNKEIDRLKAGDFAGLVNLTTLNLSNNQLTTLPENLFAGLSNLSELNLRNNRLTTLPENLFAGLSNLRDLNLSNNRLTTLPTDIFANLSTNRFPILDLGVTIIPNATDFVTVWETFYPYVGTSDGRIIIETTGSGYDYDVDCDGDGIDEHTNQTGNVICTYPIPGNHVVIISGTFPRIGFNNTVYIRSVAQWGTGAWTSMENAFRGAYNLDITATDTPDLSQVTNMSNMFKSASGFTGTHTNMNNWDVSSVTDMSNMFNNARSFNGDISGWDVSNVTTLTYTFSGATTFDQNIGGWDVSGVDDFVGMFDRVTLSIANYEKLLIGWAAQELKDGKTLDFGTAQYCSADSVFAKSELVVGENWMIDDGGRCPLAITSDAAISVMENQTAVTTVDTTYSTVRNQGLEYTISGGVDQDLFKIELSGRLAGVLTFKIAPDFEMPASANNSNEYIVEVTVSESQVSMDTPSDSQRLTIRITDVFSEASPTTVGNIDSLTLITGDTTSVGVSAHFTDADVGDTLTYTASSSNDTVATVTATDGTVTVIAISMGTAIIAVIATDSGGLSATQTFTVTVNPKTPDITASTNTVIAIAGTTITPITIDQSRGGVVARYSIEPSIENNLSFDINTGTISGTPEAQADSITYTITATNVTGTDTVTVAITVNVGATLSNLELSQGTLTPTFGGETNYSARVAYSVESLTVTATASSNSASVMVNGNAGTSGEASADIALAVGDTVITLMVTAEGSTPLTYTVTVTRASPESTKFITVWNVSAGETITFPGEGIYDIDWGDSSATTSVGGTTTHRYATANT